MNFSDIIYDKADRIATVTMNRPDKMNAWTAKMGAEMRTAMLDAERDDNIGAIILTGAGRAYCAGADMSSLSEISQGRASATPSAPSQDEYAKGERPDYQTPYSRNRSSARSMAHASGSASPTASTRTSGSHPTKPEWD
jgi:enoyl-CoA hydratase/carnithine racemase